MTVDSTKQALTPTLKAALKCEQARWALWISEVNTARGKLLAGSSPEMQRVIDRVRNNPEPDEQQVVDIFFGGGARAARGDEAPHVAETAQQVETAVGRAYLIAWAEGWLTAAEERHAELLNQLGEEAPSEARTSAPGASRGTARRTR